MVFEVVDIHLLPNRENREKPVAKNNTSKRLRKLSCINKEKVLMFDVNDYSLIEFLFLFFIYLFFFFQVNELSSHLEEEENKVSVLAERESELVSKVR